MALESISSECMPFPRRCCARVASTQPAVNSPARLRDACARREIQTLQTLHAFTESFVNILTLLGGLAAALEEGGTHSSLSNQS